jgi:hypothetical protein
MALNTPCSLGLSATSQQYFSLRTNQPPATSQNQPAVLFSQNKPAPAISHQPTEQADGVLLENLLCFAYYCTPFEHPLMNTLVTWDVMTREIIMNMQCKGHKSV